MNATACRKRKYGSERAASKKLSQLRKRRARNHHEKIEDHAYQCELCSAWHLTSMPREYTYPTR